MNTENNLWDLADKDLTIWLDGGKLEISHTASDILKSIYLTYRQNQFKRLTQFCKQAFEYYQEQEKVKKEFSFRKFENEINYSIVQEHEEDDKPMYRKSSRSFFDYDDKTRKYNEKIINGIITGDQEVYNELYEFEFPKVVRLIVKYSGTQDVAKDVFQDAIIILIEKVYTKKLDLTCSVKTYLYSICKHLWMDQLRQNKREQQIIKLFDEEYSTNEISIQYYNTPDIFENVSSAIRTLGDPCQQLLECYYYKNMSWDQIAINLGYSNAASARNQKYKCLERIRSKVSIRI